MYPVAGKHIVKKKCFPFFFKPLQTFRDGFDSYVEFHVHDPRREYRVKNLLPGAKQSIMFMTRERGFNGQEAPSRC
jgi:hypothetical protein